MKYYKNYYFENVRNCLIIIMILSIFVILSIVNYKLGIGYCKVSDIPLDFILPTSGIPISIGIPIVLFFFESLGIYNLLKKLNKIDLIESILEF